MEKVAVFDADGVVVLNQPTFAELLSQRQQIAESEVIEFFNGPFKKCITGALDLKDALEPYLKKWKWEGTVDSLIEYWFASEANLNHPLLHVIKEAKSRNIPCYLATNQEKYRMHYFADHLGFLTLFDHMFVSNEIGAKKPAEKFYRYLIDSIKYLENIESPSQILFWDDTPEYVEAAKNLGITAALYTSVNQVESSLGL